MDSAQEHWNSVYRNGQISPRNPNQPILVDALKHFGGNVADHRLLDLGSGLGEASLFFANQGASVVSVDNSNIAISNLRAYCASHDISNITPIQMNASEIADIGPFDFIFGSFILHHIEPFDEFAHTLRTALRPGGKAFFYENSAVPLLMWFRSHVVGKLWIPKVSDDEEYPLTPNEVSTLREYFCTEVVYPHLMFFRLMASYLLPRRIGERPLAKLDDLLYRVPHFRQYSYRQYILLS